MEITVFGKDYSVANGDRNDPASIQESGRDSREVDRCLPRETQGAWGHTWAAHGDMGTNKPMIITPAVVSDTMEDFIARLSGGPTNVGCDDNLNLVDSGPRLEHQNGQIIIGPSNVEAQDPYSGDDPSQGSSPILLEDVESDPFNLAPYIEEAFYNKQEKAQRRVSKAEKNREKQAVRRGHRMILWENWFRGKNVPRIIIGANRSARKAKKGKTCALIQFWVVRRKIWVKPLRRIAIS
ncbi:hypothetical protein ACS0TY_012218 [Phlomoides rotata]